MQRSQRKLENKKARQARQPQSGKKGFRSLVIGDETYLFRIARNSADIRRVRDGKKIVVRIWQLFGLTRDEWEAKRWRTLCGGPECNCGVEAVPYYGARPGSIRRYLEKEENPF